MLSTFFLKRRVILFSLIAALWLMIPTLVYFSNISVDYESYSFIYGLALVLLAISLIPGYFGLRMIQAIFETFAATFALLTPLIIVTYLAMSLKYPLQDELLVSMDEAMGFNWHAFIAFVDSRPLLAQALAKAYTSFTFQLFLLPFALILFQQFDRAYGFLFGYGILVLISSVVCIWFPALGTYTVYNFDLGTAENINSHYGYFFLDSFNAVRSSEPFTLRLQETAGIVTFPSVHAGVAFLVMWGIWSVKLLRYPVILLNMLMAISAVSHANHYLVDVVAGALIAAVSAAVASKLFLATNSRKHAPSEPTGALEPDFAKA